MRRVVILGPVGAGKSTLAKRLSARTRLPVVHLDLLFWRPGWTPAPPEEAARDLAAAIAGDRWILDGNFLQGTEGWDERFDRADTVVLLDRSRGACLWRVFKRAVSRGGGRSDLPPGCRDGIDRTTLRWIWSYPRRDRPRMLDLLERLNGQADVHRLGSRGDVERLLAGATAEG